MKKIILLLVLALGLPACLSAQIHQKSLWQQWRDGTLEDKKKPYKQSEADARYAQARSKGSKEDRNNAKLDGLALMYGVPCPGYGFNKLVCNRTKDAFTKMSKNGYYRMTERSTNPLSSLFGLLRNTYIDLFHRDGYVEVEPTPKELMYVYAYKHATEARQRLLETLEKDPFATSDDVDDVTRRAYEYRQCILENGGLNGCRSQFVEKYGEKKVVEFENLLKVREKWVVSKDKNPVFALYTLTGNFSHLQSLNGSDYYKLEDFFSGKEPAEGITYREYSHSHGYFVNPSIFNGNRKVVYGTEIIVRISDTLEANFLPEDLSMRIYKAPKDTWNTWKNSKSL